MIALAREHHWQRGIELGLGHGLLFARFLAEGLEMIGVDLGNRPDRRHAVQTAMDDIANGNSRAAVYWQATHDAAPLVQNEWADFIFIDAGHSFEAVDQDIRDWLPKLKPGGWFGGHDYHPNHPGVVRAVDLHFANRIKLHDGWIWEARL